MSPDVKFLSSRFHGVNSQFPLTSQWLCHQRLSTQIEKITEFFASSLVGKSVQLSSRSVRRMLSFFCQKIIARALIFFASKFYSKMWSHWAPVDSRRAAKGS